jgi:hypothetical protein
MTARAVVTTFIGPMHPNNAENTLGTGHPPLSRVEGVTLGSSGFEGTRYGATRSTASPMG